MSGPVVAIGFILLIPSILGMLASALLFSGAITYGGNESAERASRPVLSQTDTEATFRNACAKEILRNLRPRAGKPYWSRTSLLPVTAEYCECALSVYERAGPGTDAGTAVTVCTNRLEEGSLSVPSQAVQAFYAYTLKHSGTVEHAEPDGSSTNAVHVFGGSFAIALGIACFVGGLLGWLLVMRKRVLKCSVCGAVVNAS